MPASGRAASDIRTAIDAAGGAIAWSTFMDVALYGPHGFYTDVEASGSAGRRGDFITSPEVGPDRRITLRLLAPNAKTVVASGELDGKPHPLTRDDNGVWSVTIGPLAPDIYTYAFNVDGVTAISS